MDWLALIQGPFGGLVAVVGLLVVGWRGAAPVVRGFLTHYQEQQACLLREHAADRAAWQASLASLQEQRAKEMAVLDKRLARIEARLLDGEPLDLLSE